MSKILVLRCLQAESMGQYLLRGSLKQQGAALTDIEDEAPIEADAQQEIPSALRVQVPLIPTNSSGDIPLTAWDDDDDDSDDFASYGGAASIDLGVASPLSHMTVANVQPVQPSPQKRPKVEVLDAPDFEPQMAPVAQQHDQAVVHPAKIKVKIDPVMSMMSHFSCQTMTTLKISKTIPQNGLLVLPMFGKPNNL